MSQTLSTDAAGFVRLIQGRALAKLVNITGITWVYGRHANILYTYVYHRIPNGGDKLAQLIVGGAPPCRIQIVLTPEVLTT